MRMTWGAMIYQQGKRYVLYSVDDALYEVMQQRFTSDHGHDNLRVLAGKREIPDDRMPLVCEALRQIVEKLNEGQSIEDLETVVASLS